MKKSAFFLFVLVFFSAKAQQESEIKKSINNQLEKWHLAAAEANFDAYFDLMTSDAVFIGTDATENWEKKEFREWSRPYFEAGKAWSFSTLERNIYLDDNPDTAWFDELLDTQMGICRGSGVMKKEEDRWLVKHYVLSVAVPNEYVDQLTAIKKEKDGLLILELRN